MYDSNFLCTYQLVNDDDLSDDLYRCQFLQACKLKSWNDNTVNTIINYLEKLTKSDPTFQSALKSSQIQQQFIFLLAYPYFHITHRCICDIITHNHVLEKHKNELFIELNKNIN